MTKSTFIGGTLVVEIAPPPVPGQPFPVTTAWRQYSVGALTMTFAANGVNVANVDLSVGTKGEVGGGRLDLRGLVRGSRARIRTTDTFEQVFAGPQRNFLVSNVLFDGVLDDFFPGMSVGQFQLKLRIVGRLSWLASGTLQSSNIVPSSYLDRGVSWNTAFGQLPFYSISNSLAKQEFWGALRSTLLEIATDDRAPTDSLTAQIQQEFGRTTNSLAAEVLGDITAPVPLVCRFPGSRDTVIDGFVDTINTLFTTNWAYETFLNRIIKIGGMLRFAVLEAGESIQVIPWVPCAPSANALILNPDTYQVVQSNLTSYRRYSGAVLVSGGARDSDSTDSGLVIGRYRRTDRQVGQVHVAAAPEFMASLGASQFSEPNTASRSYTGELGPIGDELAKAFCWEEMYGPRKLRVQCPFMRMDIGPLSQVKLPFPANPDIQWAVESPGMYGLVEQVIITVDCTTAQVSTTFDLGFVRSFDQQQEIDQQFTGHPFWNRYFIGSPLGTSFGTQVTA